MSRLSACGPGCGWCGRCSAAWDFDGAHLPDEPIEQCDICENVLGAGRVTIAGVGQFCCRTHADIGVEQHELALTAGRHFGRR